MNRPPSFVDLYDLLGVSHSASTKEIKLAAHKLMLKYHSDKQAGDAQKIRRFLPRFRAIRNAYEILSDTERRREYDEEWFQKDQLFPAKKPVERPEFEIKAYAKADLGRQHNFQEMAKQPIHFGSTMTNNYGRDATFGVRYGVPLVVYKNGISGEVLYEHTGDRVRVFDRDEFFGGDPAEWPKAELELRERHRTETNTRARDEQNSATDTSTEVKVQHSSSKHAFFGEAGENVIAEELARKRDRIALANRARHLADQRYYEERRKSYLEECGDPSAKPGHNNFPAHEPKYDPDPNSYYSQFLFKGEKLINAEDRMGRGFHDDMEWEKEALIIGAWLTASSAGFLPLEYHGLSYGEYQAKIKAEDKDPVGVPQLGPSYQAQKTTDKVQIFLENMRYAIKSGGESALELKDSLEAVKEKYPNFDPFHEPIPAEFIHEKYSSDEETTPPSKRESSTGKRKREEDEVPERDTRSECQRGACSICNKYLERRKRKR